MVVVVSVVSVAGLRLSEVVDEVASDGKEDGCGSELPEKGSEERERQPLKGSGERRHVRESKEGGERAGRTIQGMSEDFACSP